MPMVMISGGEVYGGLVHGNWGIYNSDGTGLFTVDSRDVAPLLTAGFQSPTQEQVAEAKKAAEARAKALEEDEKRREKAAEDAAKADARPPANVTVEHTPAPHAPAQNAKHK